MVTIGLLLWRVNAMFMVWNCFIPMWNRVEICNHKNLTLSDYLIDAEPELNGGQDFMGTLVHFGSDNFKTWEDVLVFFSRLGGQ